MNKTEFITKVKCICGKEPDLSSEDYNTIEYVYTWHPSIDNVRGKEQIAYLYAEFGIAIINDMMQTAIAAQEAEQDMLKAKAAYESAKAHYDKLKQRGSK